MCTQVCKDSGMRRSLGALRSRPSAAVKCPPVKQLPKLSTCSVRCQATPPDSPSPDSPDPASSSRGPQLPPRPPKDAAAPEDPARARSSGRASSSGRGLEDFKRGLLPPPPPPPSNERLLAGLIAYSGMLGTIACAVAQATNIDVWGSWHWDVHDTALAMGIVLPIMAYNAAIIVPDYSNWRLPDAEALLAQREHRSKPAAGVDAASSSSQGPASTPAALGSDAVDVAATTAAPGSDTITAGASSSSSPQAPAAATTATVSTADAANAPSGAKSPGAPVLPAAQWGRPRKPSQLQLWKDACHLAQGMLLSGNSPASSLTPVLGASVLALDTLTTELLYRSVMLQLLGGWMTDRLYETGLDDTVPVPISMLGGTAAVGLVAATSALALVRRAVRVARRRPLVLDLQRSSKPEGKARLVVRDQGTKREPLAAKAASPSEGEGKAGKERVVLPSSGGPASAIVLSQVVQGARELLQNGVLGIAFVVTGNLAAVYAAALVNTLLLASLQQWGLARTRARSLAFAQQLQQLNTKMKLRVKVRDGSAAAANQRRDVAASAASSTAEHSAAATSSSDAVSSSTKPAAAEAMPQEAEDTTYASHGSSHMARTISLLELLLPEEMSAAANGHPGK